MADDDEDAVREVRQEHEFDDEKPEHEAPRPAQPERKAKRRLTAQEMEKSLSESAFQLLEDMHDAYVEDLEAARNPTAGRLPIAKLKILPRMKRILLNNHVHSQLLDGNRDAREGYPRNILFVRATGQHNFATHGMQLAGMQTSSTLIICCVYHFKVLRLLELQLLSCTSDGGAVLTACV